jgi:predicted transcriptional regulator
MSEKNVTTPTEAELEVLKILWENGPSTVRFVHENMNEKRRTRYTTTLKIMQIMHEKGIVSRNTEMRTHVYKAGVRQDDIEKRFISKLMDSVFSGSAARLVVQALGTHKPSGTELAEIKKLIRDIETKNSER